MAAWSIGCSVSARVISLLPILLFLLCAANALAVSPTAIRVPALAQRDNSQVNSPAMTGTASSASPTTATYFSAQIVAPPSVALNESAVVTISQDAAEIQTTLVLCQTNADSGSSPSSENTWFVLTIPEDDYGGYNPNTISVTFPITLYSIVSNADWTNFFFCWAIGTVDPFTGIICESYSNYFDVTEGGQSSGGGSGSSSQTSSASDSPTGSGGSSSPTSSTGGSQTGSGGGTQIGSGGGSSQTGSAGGSSQTGSAGGSSGTGSGGGSEIGSGSGSRRALDKPHIAADVYLIRRGVEPLTDTLSITQSTAVLALSTQSSHSTTSSISSSSTTPSPSSNPATTTIQPQKGLSEHAKIGIGVGVPVIVILLASLVAVWYTRRRKQSKAATLESKDVPGPKVEGSRRTVPQELPSGNLARETDGNPIHESDGNGILDQPFELGDTDRSEQGAVKNYFPPTSGAEKLRASDPSTTTAKLALNAGSSSTKE